MADLITAVQRALEALEKIADWDGAYGPFPERNEEWRAMTVVTARESVIALRAVVAKLDQEPVAYKVTGKLGDMCRFHSASVRKGDFVYTAPPPRAWRGLTDEEYAEIRLSQELDDIRPSEMLRKVEAKLKEKNA